MISPCGEKITELLRCGLALPPLEATPTSVSRVVSTTDDFDMITQQEAEQLVYARINHPDPYWPDKPEMVVVRVEEHELGWLVFYDSRLHHDTRDFRHAIAGNSPYLVSGKDGAMIPTGTAASFEDRVREAEIKLRSQEDPDDCV